MAWRRFTFAILSRLTIIMPMLIIIIGTSPIKTVFVVLVLIFIFIVSIALFSSAKPASLLTATAGYAVVLMVFISNTNPKRAVGS